MQQSIAVYDKYYQSENYFGEPYPELVAFFQDLPERGNLLDLGCGQGRDSIALARLGFNVTGIDTSSVGIRQMNQLAKEEGLPLEGRVGDIYLFTDYQDFQYILFDSMFHFIRKDLNKEKMLIDRAINAANHGAMIIFCIPSSKSKIGEFDRMVGGHQISQRTDREFMYTFRDPGSGHESVTKYKMIAIKK